MNGTVTMPTQSVVTFNKHGIVKVEHQKIAEIEMTEENVEMFLGLMGTSIEEIVDVLDVLDPSTKDIIPQYSKEVNRGKSNKSGRKSILQSTNSVCHVQ